jgi:hypothetical protein
VSAKEAPGVALSFSSAGVFGIVMGMKVESRMIWEGGHHQGRADIKEALTG